MDFLFGLPRIPNGCDGIWVIVDRFTSDAYFMPIKKTFPLDQLAKLHVDKIVSQYRTRVSVILNRDSCFTSKFWPKLQEASGTKLHFNIRSILKPMVNLKEQFRYWKTC